MDLATGARACGARARAILGVTAVVALGAGCSVLPGSSDDASDFCRAAHEIEDLADDQDAIVRDVYDELVSGDLTPESFEPYVDDYESLIPAMGDTYFTMAEAAPAARRADIEIERAFITATMSFTVSAIDRGLPESTVEDRVSELSTPEAEEAMANVATFVGQECDLDW